MYVFVGIISILYFLAGVFDSSYRSLAACFSIALLFASVSYILFCLFPSKSRRAMKIKKIVFSSSLVVGLGVIYYLSTLPHKKIEIVYTAWSDQLFWWSVISGIIAGVINLVRFLININQRPLKHGPEFCSPNTDEKAGIKIGGLNKHVLPDIAQSFCPDEVEQIVIPFNRLSRGITILGDQGSGKSRLMKAIQDGVRRQYPDIPILIHDPKGEWLRTCYDPATDLIFAPHDERTCGWRIWEDFKKHPELKHSLITTAVESHHSGNSDRFWSDSATQLLKLAVSKPDVETAKKLLVLKKKENQSDKTFQSIYATAILAFRDMATVDFIAKSAPPKTIDDLLAHKGRIFLLNNPCCTAEQHGALTLMLSAFLLQAISQPDLGESELRAAVFIDEALTFHLPGDIERVVYSQSRSKGLCIVASAQRLPDSAYGERGMWANQANHIFAMRVSDLRTREAFTQRIGKIIFDEIQSSSSKHGSTTTEIERNYSAIPPESFGALRNREFILFHDRGVAPGIVVNAASEQRENIKPIQYTPQDQVLEFLADI